MEDQYCLRYSQGQPIQNLFGRQTDAYYDDNKMTLKLGTTAATHRGGGGGGGGVVSSVPCAV